MYRVQETPATGAADLDGYAAIPPTPWGSNCSLTVEVPTFEVATFEVATFEVPTFEVPTFDVNVSTPFY